MDNLKYNGEHYRDETAEKAIKESFISRTELKRIKAAMKETRAVLQKYGFSPANRIYLFDTISGKTFK